MSLFKTSYRFPNTIEEIDNMSGKEFEIFLFHYFKLSGYQVKLTDDSGDRGIDINVDYKENNENKRMGVQAKRWKSNVGHQEITAMLSGKEYYNCSELLIVTTSGLTAQAQNTALNNDVIVWTRNNIIEILSEIKNNPKAEFTKTPPNSNNNINEVKPPENNTPDIPTNTNNDDENSIQTDSLEEDLFNQLKELRTELAKKLNIYPVYYIYNNKTIEEIIAKLPLSRSDMLEISGITEKKADQFGEEISKIVYNYCNVKWESEISELVIIRERIKNYNHLESDQAAFRNNALIRLAQIKPQSINELQSIKGFPKENIEIFGEYLIKQIQKL